jgi:hypothetical protein
MFCQYVEVLPKNIKVLLMDRGLAMKYKGFAKR